MTTAEKRADLTARGESWPECLCHGEPMLWKRDQRRRTGGWFSCRVVYLAWQNQKREARHTAGLCVHCGSDRVETTISCGPCREVGRNAERKHSEKPQRRMALASHQHRRRARRRAQEGFQSTRTGQAAIAAAMARRTQPTGEV